MSSNKELSPRAEVKQQRHEMLDGMPFGQIVWYVVLRYRVILLILSNVTTLTVWITQQGPVAAHNLGL